MEEQNPTTQLSTTTTNTTSTPPKSTAPSMASLDIKPRRNKYALACAMLASMTTILIGYDVAVMSGAQLFIKEDLRVTDTQIEILAGVINLYSLLGSLAAGRTSDWIGRRYTMVLAAAIFFAGALTMGLAPDYAVLMVGRFVAGVGVGYALMIAPVYTAELSPAASRGALTSFPEVFINSGVLLGYVANFAFAKLPLRLGWRAMFLAGAVPPVFLGAGVLAMPESPRWLVMQGRLDDARRVLAKTTGGPDEAELRLQEIKESLGEHAKRRRGEGVWRELLVRPTPSVRRILLAALGLQFFQQASGIDSVVLYSPRVFQKAGIRSDSNSLGATVAVGFTKTAFILVATFFLDRVGRRPLLLASAGGMVASLLALASALRIIDDRAHDHSDGHGGAAAAVAIAAVLSFVGSFSIGLGPIAWVYSSEIFPLRLRAQGASMGTGMNRVMSGVITMTFISLYNAITISGSFFLYAGVAAMGWVFFYVFLPETRGRSLEDMEVLFGRKRVEEEKEKGKEGGEEGVVENKGDAEGESQENNC
ncbi:polyol transporter 5-like [Ananas comosus]|uniref:Polyol transporter 5-like n=1 Tax=Ananas comosus TaxID=4615 RepID=A0A6P5FUZ2_ANACO|nr:polyol transporter 5-like [Ananas comosus]